MLLFVGFWKIVLECEFGEVGYCYEVYGMRIGIGFDGVVVDFFDVVFFDLVCGVFVVFVEVVEDGFFFFGCEV